MLPVHCNAEPHSLSDLISILDMYDTGDFFNICSELLLFVQLLMTFITSHSFQEIPVISSRCWGSFCHWNFPGKSQTLWTYQRNGPVTGKKCCTTFS